MFLGVSVLSVVEIIYFIAFRQLNDDTEHVSESLEQSVHSISKHSVAISESDDTTTIASIEIKADETIVRNGY